MINGTKQLTLEATEVAVVLDALAVQPFNKVAGVIQKIMSQCQEKTTDVQPESEGAH